MIYETEILFRGKLAPIGKLSPTSNRKIKMVCPGCGKHYERFAKVLFSTGNFLCQECSLNNIHKKTLEVGAKYNKLTVLRDYPTGRSMVKCDCGVVKEVDNWNLKSGKTKSCGCIISEKLKEHRKKNPGAQSGENHPNWKGVYPETEIDLCPLMSTRSGELKCSDEMNISVFVVVLIVIH